MGLAGPELWLIKGRNELKHLKKKKRGRKKGDWDEAETLWFRKNSVSAKCSTGFQFWIYPLWPKMGCYEAEPVAMIFWGYCSKHPRCCGNTAHPWLATLPHVHPQKSWSVPIAPPCDPRPCPTTALVLQESHGIPQQDCLPNIAGFGWIRSLLQSEPAFCGNLAETSVMGSAGLPPHFTQTHAPVHCAWSLGGPAAISFLFSPFVF